MKKNRDKVLMIFSRRCCLPKVSWLYAPPTPGVRITLQLITGWEVTSRMLRITSLLMDSRRLSCLSIISWSREECHLLSPTLMALSSTLTATALFMGKNKRYHNIGKYFQYFNNLFTNKCKQYKQCKIFSQFLSPQSLWLEWQSWSLNHSSWLLSS